MHERDKSERNARTVTFLAAAEAEYADKPSLVVLLCLVAMTEGMDSSLFPSVTKALLRLEDVHIDNLGYMASVQALFQALGGPFWGILAARGIRRRRCILAFGAVTQGVATVVMCFFLHPWSMLFLRALNGFALSALRPIANGIIGDTFNDADRGKFFGFVQMSLSLGSAIAGLVITDLSEVEIWADIYGWKVSFIVIGAFTMMLGPLILLLLREPEVNVAFSPVGGYLREVKALRKFMSRWTFAACVFQGCFGVIPWRAFEFRIFFYQLSGISDARAGILHAFGGFSAGFGNLIGGAIGDALNTAWPLHGRVLTSELSVFGGIPIAYLTFTPIQAAGWSFWYFLFLVVLLGFVATWPPAGTNAPVLCSLSTESERSLVLAWQASMEGAVGALGPMLFTFLLSHVFSFNPDCLKTDSEGKAPSNCEDADSNAKSAGDALFWTSCLPWAICGLLYSTMHCSYPRDVEAVAREIEIFQHEVQLGSMESMPPHMMSL